MAGTIAEQRVTVNGETVATRARTLEALLVERGYAELKVATALNGTFVPARARAAQQVTHGDHVEVVSARQGG